MCNCKYYHKISTATVSATNILLVPDTPVTISDKTRFCFRVCADIPSSADALPVVITLNGVDTNAVWDKYGDPATGAEIKEKRCYRAWYGSTTPHIIVEKMPISKECV